MFTFFSYCKSILNIIFKNNGFLLNIEILIKLSKNIDIAVRINFGEIRVGDSSPH